MNDAARSVLERLRQVRETDAPTHGGGLLSYVYDSGEAILDDLAAQAAVLALPVNGLDPTAFPSVAAMERDLITFARTMLNGDRGRGARQVTGSITSGGTESCLLAVKTARDLWRASPLRAAQQTGAEPNLGARMPRLVAPATVHAAFQKACHYFGLEFDAVPVDATGVVDAADVIARLGDDVALVVLSAPSYPTGQLDPIREVAAETEARGISLHVDACIGGFALPWWPGLPAWDFRVPGVTSVSADLHKFGYAPKGTSVLLHRGRVRHRTQFFATKRWPGYPVVNSTMLGSKSAASLAAAWAVVTYLGTSGYAELTAQAYAATQGILTEVEQIPGLRVLGDPVGPLFALAADESMSPSHQVDPHHFADRLTQFGFRAQPQPGFLSRERVPHSVHFTVTPVVEGRLPEIFAAMRETAALERGRPRANPRLELLALRTLGLLKPDATIGPNGVNALLTAVGMGSSSASLPARMAPLMRILEELPPSIAEALLTEIVARLSDPR